MIDMLLFVIYVEFLEMNCG
jgi:hypothetical protein